MEGALLILALKVYILGFAVGQLLVRSRELLQIDGALLCSILAKVALLELLILDLLHGVLSVLGLDGFLQLEPLMDVEVPILAKHLHPLVGGEL